MSHAERQFYMSRRSILSRYRAGEWRPKNEESEQRRPTEGRRPLALSHTDGEQNHAQSPYPTRPSTTDPRVEDDLRSSSRYLCAAASPERACRIFQRARGASKTPNATPIQARPARQSTARTSPNAAWTKPKSNSRGVGSITPDCPIRRDLASEQIGSYVRAVVDVFSSVAMLARVFMASWSTPGVPSRATMSARTVSVLRS